MGKYTIEYMPLDEATKPRSGEVVVDAWWASDPDKGLIFARFSKRHRTPQYNRNKEVAEHLMKDLYPDCEVIQVPLVFLGYERWNDD